jgi:hypothetical protein
MMTMTEDFTKLSPGTLVSVSRVIVRCTLCGRCGALEVRSDGSRRCVHVESSVIHTDGMIVEPRDSCELTGASSTSQGSLQRAL